MMIQQKLHSYFIQHCPAFKGILAVYLFGSHGKEKANKRSDIDIAFLFDYEFYKRDRFEAIRIAESLGYEITKIFKLPVDVTVLNSSSIAFAHAVVIEGIFVYEADRGQRILYEIILGNQFEELH